MAIYPVKYVPSASGELIPVLIGFDNATIIKEDGTEVAGKITSADGDRILVASRGDVVENDPILATNNTFSIKAMDQTIKHLITRNHTKLMEFEYHRLGIKRYNLKFSDFIDEPRLAKKSESVYYPKRYTHYEFDRFIHENQRRDYRRCDVFNEPVNMLEIAARPNIFHRNFLMFIDGHFVNTGEVYPLDDRLGFIIDVATEKNQHGISFANYRRFKDKDADVTVFVVPNFNIGIIDTNIPTMNQYEGLIPFTRIPGFTNRFDNKPVAEPMIFFNDTTDLSFGVQASKTFRFEYTAYGKPEKLWVNMHDLDVNISKRRIVCIQFPYELEKLQTSATDPCFELTKNQVPVPVENLLPMRLIYESDNLPEHFTFDQNIEYHAFYPNIYATGNILSHTNQIPVGGLTEEAVNAGITIDMDYKCTLPANLPEDTDIALFEYPDGFVLKKGIYTFHQCHIEYEGRDGELIVFPDTIDKTIDVEQATMRLFEDELIIRSIRFKGSTGETDVDVTPVIEPGDTYHSDTMAPGTDVVYPAVETRVFYLDLDIDIDLYHNDLKEYNWYRQLIDDYRNCDVPYPLIEYTQEDFTCSYEDFKHSMWLPSLVNYRFARLREYVEKYPNFIRTYINNIRLPLEKYYVKMEGIDLTKRLRMDTYSESLVGNDDMEFDESRYVFAMNRQFLFQGDYAFRLFLDGMFLANFQYITKSNLDFYYLYLKADMVKKDSILEIERFRLYKDLHLTIFDEDHESIIFRAEEPHIVQAREIYLADVAGALYLKPEDYKLEYYDEEHGQTMEISPTSCFVVTGKDITISLKNKDLYGVEIRYGVNQDASMATGPEYQANGDELMLAGTGVTYTKVDFRNTGNFDDRSYRVFNNGRLCLPVQYYVKSHGSYGAIDSVRTRCVIYKGDQFTVDHTPSVYRVVYFAKELNEHGYIDLDGLIPLPLSLKYYDVYLNGLRLNPNHIEIISPTKCYIKNVESRQNLIIFERNHDDDSVFLTSFAYKEAGHSDAPMDTLMRDLQDYKAWLDSVHMLINVTEKDQLEGGVISDEALAGLFIYGDILWNQDLNCNKYNKTVMEKIRYEFPDEIVDHVYRIDSIEKIETATLYKQVNPNLHFEQKFGGKTIQRGGYRHAIEEVYLGGRSETS